MERRRVLWQLSRGRWQNALDLRLPRKQAGATAHRINMEDIADDWLHETNKGYYRDYKTREQDAYAAFEGTLKEEEEFVDTIIEARGGM